LATGVLLIVTFMDGAKCPLLAGVCLARSESIDDVTFFAEHVRREYWDTHLFQSKPSVAFPGTLPRQNFAVLMSDRGLAFEHVFKVVFPELLHKLCFRHIDVSNVLLPSPHAFFTPSQHFV
jgi:hypothetical protein